MEVHCGVNGAPFQAPLFRKPRRQTDKTKNIGVGRYSQCLEEAETGKAGWFAGVIPFMVSPKPIPSPRVEKVRKRTQEGIEEDEENLKKMRKRLSTSGGSFMLPPDAEYIEKVKYEICKKILIFMHKRELSQRELAKMLEVPETRVSEIVHYKIYKFNLERLLRHYRKLNPNAHLSVA